MIFINLFKIIYSLIKRGWIVLMALLFGAYQLHQYFIQKKKDIETDIAIRKIKKKYYKSIRNMNDAYTSDDYSVCRALGGLSEDCASFRNTKDNILHMPSSDTKNKQSKKVD